MTFDPAALVEHKKAEFSSLLDNLRNENAFQSYLEQETYHLPTPVLLNHDVLFGSIFSKVHLHHNRRITDYSYATKSSDEFRLCHVELEDPKKAIFRTAKDVLECHPDFLQALHQVRTWKSQLEETNQDWTLFEAPFGRWMNELSFSRSYILIYGRSREIDSPQKQRLWHTMQKETGFIIKTADQAFEAGGQRRNGYLNVLKRVQDRFAFKHLHVEPIQIFSYLGPLEFSLKKDEISRLEGWGFSMDDWRKGNRLVVNGKYPSAEKALEQMRTETSR